MQEWEIPLMEEMANSISAPGGAVLEIGYGLGISSRFIQSQRPRLHVIIEANRDVAARARLNLKHLIDTQRVVVVEDFWQNVVRNELLKNLCSDGFDGILFDSFPLTAHEWGQNHFQFFDIARQLLARGGRFTYYSDTESEISADHLNRIQSAFNRPAIYTKIVALMPPPDCQYWTSKQMLHIVIVARDQ